MFKKLIFTIVLLFTTTSAYSWDGAHSGKIVSIEITGGTNFGFRVHLEGAPQMCGSQFTWAYLNEGDSNYNTYVSGLLAAKMSGVNVVIYTNKVTHGSNDFCRIGHVSINQ